MIMKQNKRLMELKINSKKYRYKKKFKDPKKVMQSHSDSELYQIENQEPMVSPRSSMDRKADKSFSNDSESDVDHYYLKSEMANRKKKEFFYSQGLSMQERIQVFRNEYNEFS